MSSLLSARAGRTLTLTLNRPAMLNALDPALHQGLDTALDAFEADPDLWVAILTGAGRAFSAGNDLKALAKGRVPWPKGGFGGICARQRTKPVIAAVNGLAYGGGFEIALACDLIIAAPDARFCLPEARVGLFPNAGGIQRLSRQIGRKAAMDILLTGRVLTADEALALGVVNAIAEDPLSAAHAKAAEICALSPQSIRATLQALAAMDAAEGFADALGANDAIGAWLDQTEDAAEGVAAFNEKRKAIWRNR